jgi:hypothetical protein
MPRRVAIGEFREDLESKEKGAIAGRIVAPAAGH